MAGREVDAAVQDYVALAGWLWDPIGRAVARHVEPRPDTTLLDACCGVGSSAVPLAERIGPEGSVTAVDADDAMVAHLRDDERRPSWLRPHCADAPGFPARNLDHVVCVHGITSFDDPSEAGRALVAKLRWGGRFTVAVWAPGAMIAAARAATQARATALGDATAACATPVSELSDPARLRSWMRTDLDLVDVRIEPFRHSLPARPDVAWRLLLGSAYRPLTDGLGAEQLQVMRRAYLERLGKDPIDATTLVASGRRGPA